jgi:asparagine synthase (glutamine-hydrolysing)
MANFLAVVDPDAARRDAFCAAAGARIAPFPGLTRGECGAGPFRALWAAGPDAPVSRSSGDQAATVVWGTPIGEDPQGHLTAEQVAGAWAVSGAATPSAFDGYFAALSWSAPGQLVAGTDLLGVFPLFWWASGDVLLVGSSPELFRHHPLVHFDLDLAGLTGILMTFHAVGGRTLTKGVRRLAPGHALVWQSGSTPREVLVYSLPASTRNFDLPGWAAAELVDKTLRRSVARHLPRAGQPALTLTGGRDSRLLAGIMVELGRAPVAVTLGNEDDVEMQCARAVARTLKLEHRSAAMRLDRDELPPELHARWLHCTSGFNSSEYWYCHEDFRGLPPYLVTGCIMGSIVGGALAAAAYSETTGRSSFETMFMKNSRAAIDIGQLRRLLRPELFGSLVDDVMSDLRRTYESYSPFESQRAWCFDLHHRQRLHVGALTWQFSFGSWPVNPAVDKEVLAAVGGIPAGVLAEKRLHDEILRSYFPALAELPLDRNGYDTTPISPRLRDRIKSGLRNRMGPLARVFANGERPGRERRFYYRLLDFNGPMWRETRRRAEPHRSKLYALFDRETLDSLLPPPDADFRSGDGITDGSARRLLVGLCLWAKDHL